MAANSTSPPLLNPSTPFAFLPPEISKQFEASIYLFVACLSVSIREYIMSILAEDFDFRPGLRSRMVNVDPRRD
jgi:hypothetical protein